jgi:phosphatidylserine/phosphatidylglycerophosphate/cardiolipin synthase-like enzyme
MDVTLLCNEEIYRKLVVERMLKATRSLWIASANLKDMHVERGRRYRSILKVFRELADRGVDVRVLHAGVPSERYLRSLKDAGLIRRPNFTMRRCVRVHLKCVLIDDACIFIGSPNLTGAGMGAKSGTRRNFEIGILSPDVDLYERTASLFLDIWQGAHCEPCGRKRSCPVPLEEPDF